MAELKPGDWIGGEFRIRRVFGGTGRSGMGVVYLVEGRTSEDPFVLKTYQESDGSAEVVERFHREVASWVALGVHPNIVRCFWAKRFGGQLFVAAEYIPPALGGKNLLSQFIAEGTVPMTKMVTWASQFCHGMQHAVRNGVIVHRDIKPDNLMIDGSGSLRITDFGLARGSQGEGSLLASQSTGGHGEFMTRIGLIIGTPPFMSPEQFFSPQSVDCRSDIYSFGVVLYLMISGGKFPVSPSRNSDHLTILDWALAHQRGKPPLVDSPLMPLCSRCLEKDPSRRYQSYAEFLQELRQVARKLGIAIDEMEPSEWDKMEGAFTHAITLEETGKLEETLAELRRMAVKWPGVAKIHTEIGRICLKLGQHREGLEATETSLRLDSSRSAPWNNLGVVQARLGRKELAKVAFSKALIVDPENTGAMMGMAQLLLDEGKVDKAREVAELAVWWRPEKPDTLKVASQCTLRAGDFVAAERYLERLLKLAPTDSTAWFNLSLCYRARGDAGKECFALQKVLHLTPRDPEALSSLVQACASAHDYEGALEAALKLQAVEGWELVGTCKAAQMLAAGGKPIEGCNLLKRWLNINERNASLWLTLASILLEMPGHREQAKVAAQNAWTCYIDMPQSLSNGSVHALQQMIASLK